MIGLIVLKWKLRLVYIIEVIITFHSFLLCRQKKRNCVLNYTLLMSLIIFLFSIIININTYIRGPMILLRSNSYAVQPKLFFFCVLVQIKRSISIKLQVTANMIAIDVEKTKRSIVKTSIHSFHYKSHYKDSCTLI